MPVKTTHVIKLIELLAETLDQPLDYAGFGVMSNELDDTVTQRYLDDTYRDCKKQLIDGIYTIRKSPDKLNVVAKYLKFKSFNQFSLSCDKQFSDILKSCIGNWWSYVRANSGNYILKAPVHIDFDENRQKVLMELKGEERVFIGEISEKGGCMTGFLDSGTAKRLGMTFKLGITQNIQVTQGVFCGVSTSGNPIAGKEILVREDRMEYKDMKWGRFEFGDDRIDIRIQNYFSIHADNCLQIKDLSGFTLNDISFNKQ